MATFLGTLATAVLPAFRAVTEWLAAAALGDVEPASQAVDTREMLRRSYPDAPEPWIELIAARLGVGEAFEPESRVVADGDPIVAAGDVPSASPPTARLTIPAARGETRPTMPKALAPERPHIAGAPPHADGPVLHFIEADLTTSGQRSDVASSDTTRAPRAESGKQKPVGLHVRFSVSEVDSPPPARASHFPLVRSPRPRAPVRFPTQDAPVPPRPRIAARASPNDVPAPFQPVVSKPVTPSVPTPAKSEARRVRKAAQWPPKAESVVPAQPESADHVQLRPEVSFATARVEPAGPTTIPLAPATDYWPELPASRVEPSARDASDGDRLRRLINDQVERAWNG